MTFVLKLDIFSFLEVPSLITRDIGGQGICPYPKMKDQRSHIRSFKTQQLTIRSNQL